MDIKQKLKELEDFYYGPADDPDLLFGKHEEFIRLAEEYIHGIPVDELRKVISSEDWIIDDFEIDDVPDSEIHNHACDALWEDLDNVIYGCKTLLGIKHEN